MQQIDYVDAPPGAGKTFVATRWIKQRIAAGDKIILVQPITRLIAETVDQTFPRQGIDKDFVTEITERTHPDGGIVRAIVQHVNEAPEGRGEVLVITQAAFLRLCERHRTNRDRWTVMMDETISVISPFSRNLPNSHELLTEHVVVDDNTDPSYWTIEKKAGSIKIDKMAKNALKDEVWNGFQGLASAIVSRDQQVFIKADNYNVLVGADDTPGVLQQLNAFSVLNPSILEGWGRVIMMSANFTDSLMYLLWSRREHDAVTFNDITTTFPLRYYQHRIDDSLVIHYGFDRHWSKTLREKSVEVDESTTSLQDVFVAAAVAAVGSQPVAVLANNDVAGVEQLFPNGVRLPAYAHGLNTFQHIDHAVLLLAANPAPAQIAFLRWYADLTDEEIATAIHRAMIYQAFCRISIRDPANYNSKSVFVPDRGTAEWLQSKFPGSRLHRLDLGFTMPTTLALKPGRPRLHLDDASRQKAHREREAHRRAVQLERELRLRLVNGLDIEKKYALQAALLEDAMSETRNIADAEMAREEFHGTFFNADLQANIGAALPFTSFDELVQILREAFEEVHVQKEDCWLWSPAHYVPDTRNDNPQGTRCGYVNIAYCRHIILDYDGGDLSPQQFAAMFPGMRMVVYSTWSSSVSCPKWRVLIPTDALLDIEGYKLITGQIIAGLKERGYYDASEIEKDPSIVHRRGFAGTHGFDRSKLIPAARLFVPSQGASPVDAFFLDFAGGHRSEMPVFAWIERCAVSEMPTALPQRPATVSVIAPNPKASPSFQKLQAFLHGQNAIKLTRSKDRQVESALDWWGSEGDCPGRRDHNFCILAGRLFRAGCDQFEFESHLHSAAAASRGSRAALRSKIGRLWRFVST